MSLSLRFLGATQNVTGSSTLVESEGFRCLIDCGLYQERKLASRNWDPFPVPADSIDAVLLTHAHLDHCGRLPKLYKEGFRGRIFCTAATADIARIILLDSAKIQEEDAAFKKRRHEREGREGPYPDVPLYTVADAEACLPLFKPCRYSMPFSPGGGLNVSFHDAGHILGSSSIRVEAGAGEARRTIVFSGDVGRWNTPILRDPEVFKQADYLVVESTYGNRNHEESQAIPGLLADVINATRRAGGNIVIPSFAVERTQELLYHLGGLLHEDRIPHLAVFVDSPMAIRVTEVFRRHPDLFDEATRERLEQGSHPCNFPGLVMTRSVDESKAINHIRGTSIIIAGSGMCTGGRIKHHLVNNIGRAESTVLFVGYQAVGTLGRIILEGAEEVRILGQMHAVESRIERINGFSAHADRDELYRWLSGLDEAPRQLFINHGEPDSCNAFASWIRNKTGWETTVATYNRTVNLE